MKRYFPMEIIVALCLFLLAGCGAPAEEKMQTEPETEVEETPVVQELTAVELQQYFEKAYEAKGNCLNTPEQLALEVTELETLTADSVLPEDYEAQYKAWRIEQVEGLLKNLQNEYDQIIANAPLYDGIHEGAAYADCIDFDGDGVKELLILSLSPEITDGEIYADCSAKVYHGLSGHAEVYDEEMIYCPSLYYSIYDFKSVSLVQSQGRIYVHIIDTGGQNIEDIYYGIQNNQIAIADETFADINGYSSDGQEVPYEEYEAVHSKYTEIVSLIESNSITFVQNRGILPALPSETQKRWALLEVLSTRSPQYARLADMDGDGAEELVTVENMTKTDEDSGITYDVPVFRAYVWDNSTLQAIDMGQEEYCEIGGIYREKATGKIYVNYVGGAGPFSWDYFNRIGESIKISETDYAYTVDTEYDVAIEYIGGGEEAYCAELNRFELVENLEWELPKYNTVEAVKKQLVAG